MDNETYNLLRGGDATLRECLEVSKPYDYVITSRDPIAVKSKGGVYCTQKFPVPDVVPWANICKA